MEFSDFEAVDVESNWFKVYKLNPETYCIYEPYHYQEVISYLILGRDRGLLLDTGMGIEDMGKLVGQIYSGEILVINSHIHFDHVGSNSSFEEVMVYGEESALLRLKRGYSREELRPHTDRDLFEKICDNFDLDNYQIEPSKPRPIGHGHTIDLGARKIEVIHSPGHSKESIVLWDPKYRRLFMGDTYYPGPLYIHYEGDFYGDSNLEDYLKSISYLADLVDQEGIEYIHPSHNRPLVASQVLGEVRKALGLLREGSSNLVGQALDDLKLASLPRDLENLPRGYVIPKDLYIYDFHKFKVIIRNVHKN